MLSTKKGNRKGKLLQFMGIIGIGNGGATLLFVN